MGDSLQSNGNLRTDILLLSTYLDGRQQASSKSHPKDHTLDLFVDISTLLAVGNKHNPRAENVNAVMGTLRVNVDSPTVEVLVCTENNSQNPINDIKKAPKGAHNEGLGQNADRVGGLDGLLPDSMAGRVSLNKWDGAIVDDAATDKKKYVFAIFTDDFPHNPYRSNFTFDQHLQHLFNVIVALDCDDPHDLRCFQRFIHHRAYRKLASRVLDFSTRWGISPIDIISANLDHTLTSKTFHFPTRDPAFHQFVQKCITPEPAIPSTSDTTLCYRISPDTAHLWVKVLNTAWFALQEELLVAELVEDPGPVEKALFSATQAVKKDPAKKKPVYKKIKTAPPTNGTVGMLVIVMNILDHLQVVLRHLVSTDKVAKALADAGRLDNTFLLIVSLIVPKNSRRIRRRQVHQMMMNPLTGMTCSLMIVSFAKSLRIGDSMNCSVENLRGQAAKRVLQGMKTIVAWQTSCRNVFKEARRFQNSQITWQLSQFHYHYNYLNPHSFELNRVKSLFQEWKASDINLLNDVFVQEIIDRTSRAKVHAEAGLMHWIATVAVSLLYQFSVFFTYRAPFSGPQFQPGLAYWSEQETLSSLLATASSL